LISAEYCIDITLADSFSELHGVIFFYAFDTIDTAISQPPELAETARCVIEFIAARPQAPSRQLFSHATYRQPR